MKKVLSFVAGVLICQAAFAETETAQLSQVGIAANTATGFLWKEGPKKGKYWLLGHYIPCRTPKDHSVLVIDMNSELGRSLFATAVSAFLAGRKVTVWTDGCFNGLPSVVRLDVLGLE